MVASILLVISVSELLEEMVVIDNSSEEEAIDEEARLSVMRDSELEIEVKEMLELVKTVPASKVLVLVSSSVVEISVLVTAKLDVVAVTNSSDEDQVGDNVKLSFVRESEFEMEDKKVDDGSIAEVAEIVVKVCVGDRVISIPLVVLVNKFDVVPVSVRINEVEELMVETVSEASESAEESVSGVVDVKELVPVE